MLLSINERQKDGNDLESPHPAVGNGTWQMVDWGRRPLSGKDTHFTYFLKTQEH